MALSNTTVLPKRTAEIRSQEIRLRNHIKGYWNVIRRRAKVLADYSSDFNKIKGQKDIHEFFNKHQMPIATSLVDETFISENIKSTLKKYLIDDVWKNLPRKESILKKIEHLFSKKDISELLEEMKNKLDFYYPFFNLERPVGDLDSWILITKNSNSFVSEDLKELLGIITQYKIYDTFDSELKKCSNSNYIKATEQLFNKVMKYHALQLAVLSGKYQKINENVSSVQIKRLESKAGQIIKRQRKKFFTQEQIGQMLKFIDLEMAALAALNILLLKIEDLVHSSMVLLSGMMETESELNKNSNRSFTIKGPKFNLECAVSYESAGLFSGDFFLSRPNEDQDSLFTEFHVGDVAGKGFYAARAKREFFRLERKYHRDTMLSESSDALSEKFLNLIKRIGKDLVNCKISVGRHNFISNSSLLINLGNGNVDYFSPAPIFFVKKGVASTPPAELSKVQSVMWLLSIGNQQIPKWELGNIKLESNDFILATTDGLEEVSVSGVELAQVYDIKLLLEKYYKMNLSPRRIVKLLKELREHYKSGKFLEDFAKEVYTIKRKLNLSGDLPQQIQQIINEVQKLPDGNNYKKFLNTLPEKKVTVTKGAAQTITAIGGKGINVLRRELIGYFLTFENDKKRLKEFIGRLDRNLDDTCMACIRLVKR